MRFLISIAALWAAYTIGHIKGWDHRGNAG
jgi:hypothetical protein